MSVHVARPRGSRQAAHWAVPRIGSDAVRRESLSPAHALSGRIAMRAAAAVVLLLCWGLVPTAHSACALETLDIAELPSVQPGPQARLPLQMVQKANRKRAGHERPPSPDMLAYAAMIAGTRGMVPGAVTAGRPQKLQVGSLASSPAEFEGLKSKSKPVLTLVGPREEPPKQTLIISSLPDQM